MFSPLVTLSGASGGNRSTSFSWQGFFLFCGPRLELCPLWSSLLFVAKCPRWPPALLAEAHISELEASSPWVQHFVTSPLVDQWQVTSWPSAQKREGEKGEEVCAGRT